MLHKLFSLTNIWKDLSFPQWQCLPSIQCQYAVCTPNLRQPKSETKVIVVLIINQWRVTTNTLCWWVPERSLNSSCSEADPHLCTPSAGRATARKQDRKRASDINTTTSVCSVAQFLLDIFLSDFWLMFQFFFCLFSTSLKSKPLWKVVLIIAQKLLEDLIALRFLSLQLLSSFHHQLWPFIMMSHGL